MLVKMGDGEYQKLAYSKVVVCYIVTRRTPYLLDENEILQTRFEFDITEKISKAKYFRESTWTIYSKALDYMQSRGTNLE